MAWPYAITAAPYRAIGTVTNLAARLCNEAADRQILVSSRVATAAEGFAEAQEVSSLTLMGLSVDNRRRPQRDVLRSGGL